MRFKITRTSMWGNDCPCNEAKWDSKKLEWFMNFTLPKLMKFIKKHGAVVLNSNEVEIYDGYRE